MTKDSHQDWIKQVEEEKDKIKNWNCSDRLSILSKLTFLNGSMAASVTGWNTWFTNAMISDYFSDADFKELLAMFEKLTLDFLDLDLKYTKTIKAKQEEEKQKKLEAQKKAFETELKTRMKYNV